jgi:DNA-binding IclR family transcriptional regulator
MRQVREVLRLTTAGVGLNEIARRVGVAPSTVRLTLRRLAGAGLSWPLPAEMTDSALETALFAAAGTKQGHRRHAEPDWAEIHRELKRKHVTLTMLWDEYIERCLPRGVSLLALLRAVPGLGVAAVGHDAASPHRRR